MNVITTETRIDIANNFVIELTAFAAAHGYCRYPLNVWTRGNTVRVYAEKNGYAEIDACGRCDTSRLTKVCRRIAEEFVASNA